MMKLNNLIAIMFSIVIIISLIGFHLTLDTPLFAPDAKNHYEYASFEECNSGYSNGVCLMVGWLNLSPFSFWLIFFIISMFIPLAFVLYTKNLWLFPAFFIFTGFFWQSMAMQVFAQIIVSLILVFFIFEKNFKARWVLLGLLFLIYFLGIELHSTILFVLIGIFVYEIIALFDNVMGDLYCIGKKYYWLGCGIFSKDSVKIVGDKAHSFREPINNSLGDWFQNIVYYGYSFFVENMFIGFVIPGIYKIFKDKDFRKIYYFLFVVIGALFLWVQSNFEIWWVTRVLLWLPLVLFVPFMNWLQKQTPLTKTIFIFTGLCYFFFNIWYFVNRVQGMSCL